MCVCVYVCIWVFPHGMELPVVICTVKSKLIKQTKKSH
jgi:hypothetical protein